MFRIIKTNKDVAIMYMISVYLYPHEIASFRLLKDFGRLLKKLCILANDSIAEPSTTSMTTKPMIGKSAVSDVEATFTAIAPPRL